MAVKTSYDWQIEIIDKLKIAMPEYSKNILLGFDEDNLKATANFSPAIFVIDNDDSVRETVNGGKTTNFTQSWVILCVFKDARGAVFASNEIGILKNKVRQSLQGLKLSSSSKPIESVSSPPKEKIYDQNGKYTGVIYCPILFKSEFIINGV